jgi:hypothetical protein
MTIPGNDQDVTGNSVHAQDTQHQYADTRPAQLSPRAAMLEGGMLVFNAVNTTRGDIVSSLHMAEAFRTFADWLVDSTRERLTAQDAERELVAAVNGILGERR